jgi:hypothetical protein
LTGTSGHVIEHLHAVREVTGFSYVSIRSDWIEEFAVVAALGGRTPAGPAVSRREVHPSR